MCAVRPANGLPRHLDEWVGASLIMEAQADAIQAFEDRKAPARLPPLQLCMPSNFVLRFLSDFIASPRMAG